MAKGANGQAPALRLEWRKASELADNPANWRKHPPAQVKALQGALAEVGWAGACLYNEATGRLIDGHLRKAVSKDGLVPVLVGSWTEDQERKILATLDPLVGMATPDGDELALLLAGLSFEDTSLSALMDSFRASGPVVLESSLKTLPSGGDAGYKLHEVERVKLGGRLVAAKSLPARRTCLELFAGGGQLSFWYRLLFKHVATVDSDPSTPADFHMLALDYLERKFDPSKPLDFIDFDDEGSPHAEISLFFKRIAGRKWPAFCLALTDGAGLNLKVGGRMALATSYRLPISTKASVKEGLPLYSNFPALVEHFILTVSEEAGYQAERLSLDRKANGNIVYGCWRITPTQGQGG